MRCFPIQTHFSVEVFLLSGGVWVCGVVERVARKWANVKVAVCLRERQVRLEYLKTWCWVLKTEQGDNCAPFSNMKSVFRVELTNM